MLEILTTERGLQLDTGDHLFGQTGKDGATDPRRNAVRLGAQDFLDAVNRPEFPDVVLRPGVADPRTTVHA